MQLGYRRTSTVDKQEYSFEHQEEVLLKAGAEKIFSEQASAVSARPIFQEMLDYCREGDVIMITKLDRGFRSVSHMGQVLDELEKKGVALQILDLNIDTNTPTGKLMANLLCSVSQFERELLKERQRIGIMKAQKNQKYTGRKPSIDTEKVRDLKDKGMRPTDIAKELEIGRASVYRLLKQ